MISCTEFIPVYSELFTFIEENYGKQEVENFWQYLFTPDGAGIPLINYLDREGLKGCYSYWSCSLNEEAADFSMYLNERDGWFKLEMHGCPSKGRLLSLQKEIGIVPYPDYCLHCDHYRESVEKAGFAYIYDFCKTGQAACSILIYDPEKFTQKLIIDNDTLQMHRKASDNKYFHRDFHSSLNNGIHYLGEKYGEEALCRFLERFTEDVYKDLIADIKKRGIEAIKDKIADTYAKEEAPEALAITEEKGMTVFRIAYCPAVKYLRSTGRDVTPWFPYTTTVIMKVLAKYAGLSFKMENYDDHTGKAEYTFY